MIQPDWESAGQRLYVESRAAFTRFRRTHPIDTCSHVSYHCDPHNGYVLLGFDTPENSLRVARRRQDESLPHIREMLERTPWNQADAHRFLKRHSLLPINLSSDRLAFPEEAVWRFPEWVELAEHYAEEADSRGAAATGDDPLRAAVALCVWRLVERLATDNAFDELPLARPCLVSYQDHDGPLVGLRIVNFPG